MFKISLILIILFYIFYDKSNIKNNFFSYLFIFLKTKYDLKKSSSQIKMVILSRK